MGVDAAGNRVIDPSENVLALVEAAVKRLDDLRAAETRRVDEQMELRAEYAERLANAEAKRIDAIRAVDVNAVAVASQRAADQATVLATQVVQSAEALRTLVASTAATVATSQQQLATTLSTRLTTLEQAQYEGKGKQALADPALATLVEEVRKLGAAGSVSTGKTAGIGLVGYVVAGAISMICGLLTIAAILYAVLKPAPPAPVTYAPPGAAATSTTSTAVSR